ncbi:MAG: hypothetical protein RLZZ129_72 [Verrucomicrobiota bacterium]|jgi:hypothetical protein
MWIDRADALALFFTVFSDFPLILQRHTHLETAGFGPAKCRPTQEKYPLQIELDGILLVIPVEIVANWNLASA